MLIIPAVRNRLLPRRVAVVAGEGLAVVLVDHRLIIFCRQRRWTLRRADLRPRGRWIRRPQLGRYDRGLILGEVFGVRIGVQWDFKGDEDWTKPL